LPVVVADVDAQQRDTVGAGGVVHLLQLGDLGSARAAPLAPDVDDDDLAGKGAGGVVDRHGARRVRQLGAGDRSGSTAVVGRVVVDVGFAAGSDEFEGAALSDGVIAGRAADEQAGHRRGDERQPPHGQLTAGSL
jgi:hypothetical protein